MEEISRELQQFAKNHGISGESQDLNQEPIFLTNACL